MPNKPEAKVVLHSVSPAGIEILTMEAIYHRYVHAEHLRHRVFSFGVSSSRAIPTKRLIQMVRNDPWTPIEYGSNQKGMVAGEELTGAQRYEAEGIWLQAAYAAADQAEDMLKLGVHKQVVNRLLEPFLPVRVVVTGTDWANFFALRRAPDAQPEIRALADAMWEAKQASTPRLLRPGEWHLPFVEEEDWDAIADVVIPTGGFGPREVNEIQNVAIKVSGARCARGSYGIGGINKKTIPEELELADRLLVSRHMSPFEHQATPDEISGLEVIGYKNNDPMQPEYGPAWECPHLHGNLRGWVQYRKMLPNEVYPENQ